MVPSKTSAQGIILSQLPEGFRQEGGSALSCYILEYEVILRKVIVARHPEMIRIEGTAWEGRQGGREYWVVSGFG